MSQHLSPKLVIAEAWEITRKYKKNLFWFGFLPAFLGMIIATAYVLYQGYSLQSFFGQEFIDFRAVIQKTGFWLFTPDNTLQTKVVIFSVLVLIIHFFLAVLCKGSLVFLIHNIYTTAKPTNGIQSGFKHFFAMFQFGAVKNLLELKSFYTEGIFILRSAGMSMFGLMLPVLIIFALFGVCVRFFFVYVPPCIVLQQKGLLESIRSSFKLTIEYFIETLQLVLLVLLIEIRVLINIAIILFLPVFIALASGFFATKLLTLVGIIVSLFIVFGLITLAAFIFGTLEIFSTAIWTIAFYKLSTDRENTQLSSIKNKRS